MNNKSGNDKIGTVFIQDNLVHADAQHITGLSLFGTVFAVMRLGAKKKTCPLFSQTKDRLKAFSKIWSQ